MKKSENSKILPYTKKQIASVILHPETCNIRGYQVYKKLDEDNWIEDYGDHFLMKFYFTEVSEDRIVMERYPFAQSSVHVTKTIFEMKDADNGQVELSIREKVTKGDFVRKITKVIENHDQNDTYYMDLITRIQKYCAKRKSDRHFLFLFIDFINK